MCEAVVERARDAGAVVIVNDRADIARFAHADGVHLGQDDLPPAMARQLLGGEAIVGYSTHTLEQVRAAARLPVDYIAIGPIFGTWLLLGVFGRPFCPNCKTRLVDKGLVELDRRKWIIYGCATCDRHWRVRLLESRGV